MLLVNNSGGLKRSPLFFRLPLGMWHQNILIGESESNSGYRTGIIQ